MLVAALVRGTRRSRIRHESGRGALSCERQWPRALANAIAKATLGYLARLRETDARRHDALTATNDRALARTDTLAVSVARLALQNPVVLASGTAAYGDELAGVIELDALGALVTKAVESRAAQARRATVADFPGGMINAVGLANPGRRRCARDASPVARHASPTRARDHQRRRAHTRFPASWRSCPTALRVRAERELPEREGGRCGVRCGSRGVAHRRERVARRKRPNHCSSNSHPRWKTSSAPRKSRSMLVPTAWTLVHTPGPVVDAPRVRLWRSRSLPIGVLATSKVFRATRAPIIGVGGIATGNDAAVHRRRRRCRRNGGAARSAHAERVVRDLARWCAAHNVAAIAQLTGTLEWPA